jgi:DNA-binding Lrp family transcriptional regulator
VIKRFKKIEKALKPKLTITLNLNKIGYPFSAIFCMNVSDKNKLTNVLAAITQIPNIIMATRCIGDIEIVAIAPLANFEELFKLRQEISKISGIKKMEVLLERTHNDWPPKIVSKFL